MKRKRSPKRWTSEELRIADRFIRAIAKGRYATTTGAVPAFRAALATAGLVDRRADSALAARLRLRGQRQGQLNRQPRWVPAEGQVIDRYARAVVAGEYPNVLAAVPECQVALRRANPQIQRLSGGVKNRLRARTHELGRNKAWRAWTPEEDAVVDRYARAVFAGRYRHVGQAAPDCTAAIEKLWQSLPAGSRPSTPRPEYSVHLHMSRHASGLGLRRTSSWREGELRVVDRYARGVVEHRYRDASHASVPCHRALKRYHARIGADSLGGSVKCEIRNLSSVHGKLQERVRRLDPSHLPSRRWTDAEAAIAAKWVREYDHERRNKRRADLRPLTLKMQADLDRSGYCRSLRACENRLLKEWGIGLSARSHSPSPD